MNAQVVQVALTGVLVVTTVAYTIGTFLLWRTTRAAARLTLVLALREAYQLRVAKLTSLMKLALPKDCAEIIRTASTD